MSDSLWFIGIVAALLTLYFAHSSPSTIEGKTQVPQQTPRFHLWRHEGDGDGTYEATDAQGHVAARYTDFDGDGAGGASLYQSPEQATAAVTGTGPGLRYIPDYYAADDRATVGTFAAYLDRGDNPRIDRLQLGLHYEPYRLLYGTVDAPSFAVTKDAAGLGLVLRPPRPFIDRHVSGIWRGVAQHVGVGAWYLVPFDGSGPAPAYGLTFSVP